MIPGSLHRYLDNYISFFLIFALIFYNNETFPSITYNGPLETVVLLAIIISIFFLFKILIKDKKINIKSNFIILGLICLILVTMLLNLDFRGGYLKIILGLLIGYMMIHIISFENFIEIYIKVLFILALYSLIVTYLIRPITFNMPQAIFPRFYNMVGLPLIDARLSVVVNMQNYFRNFGIFREPGVYQIFLNFALFFELFLIKRKINILNVIVFYMAIISTFSTAGYITGLIITMSFILFAKNKLDDNINRKKGLMLVLFLIVLLFLIFIIYLGRNDLLRLMIRESSYYGRIAAIKANLVTWIESPIFGKGLTQALLKDVPEKIQNYYPTLHNTSTIGALLSVFGLIFTSIYLFLIYKLISKSHCKILGKIFIFLAIMITISSQLLIYNELLYTIIIFGIINDNSSLLKEV